MTKHNAETYAF